MKLRTELDIAAMDFRVDHGSRILTLGSCFSDVIGNYLHQRKFRVKNNLFGTVYNLKSLGDVVENAIDELTPRQDRIVMRDELFFHLDYHSAFYSPTRAGLTEHIKRAGTDFREFLMTADLLIITLGSSWVYTYEGEAVSNCHKLPASRFEKCLMGMEQQTAALHRLVARLRSVNPGLRLLVTVSPVRHIKDGIPENSLSKAILRVVCDVAVKEHPGICYFPSFEVMMDDLRDYRFYKPDLIHPNEIAENHICELFMKGAVTEEARKISEEWNRIRQSMEHRPLNPGSTSQRAFLHHLLEKIAVFRPFFDISEEYKEVERRIRGLE